MRKWWLSTGLVIAFVGCNTPPVPVPEAPQQALELAETYLGRDEPSAAIAILDSIDEDRMTNDDRAQSDTIRIRALYTREDYWAAFRVARSFVEQQRFSELAKTIEEFEFLTGKALILDDDSDGETVLMHFVERFPASRHASEAYKLLGDYAFADEEFEIAELRFADLLRDHPTSEWAAYARYRLAITSFRRVRGPEYDMQQMEFARNELRDYLELNPERPEFRRDARRAG